MKALAAVAEGRDRPCATRAAHSGNTCAAQTGERIAPGEDDTIAACATRANTGDEDAAIIATAEARGKSDVACLTDSAGPTGPCTGNAVVTTETGSESNWADRANATIATGADARGEKPARPIVDGPDTTWDLRVCGTDCRTTEYRK